MLPLMQDKRKNKGEGSRVVKCVVVFVQTYLPQRSFTTVQPGRATRRFPP